MAISDLTAGELLSGLESGGITALRDRRSALQSAPPNSRP